MSLRGANHADARLLLIHNPAAGARGHARLERILSAITARGLAVELARTEFPGHATRIARDGAAEGFPRIVAAGGDGTIAEVAEGLIGSNAALGVVPLGTANVLAHERGLPFAPDHVAATLAAAATADLWPAHASTGTRSRLFVQMCGIGFDARVVATLPPRLKRVFGRFAYVLQTLRALRTYPFPRLRLAIDGIVHEAASAVISKGRFYAGPYTLLPGARPGAAGFQVALFGHGGPAAVLLYGALLPLQALSRGPGVTILPARSVELLDGVAPVQTDGDALGTTPLALEDAASPIRLIVPKPYSP